MSISLPKNAALIGVAALLLASSSSSTSASAFVPATSRQSQYHTTALFDKKTKRSPPSKGFGGSSTSSSKTRPSTSAAASSSRTSVDRFPYAGRIRPFPQSPQRQVTDDSIIKPDYAATGIPRHGASNLLPWIIPVKSPLEISRMRESGRMAREILDLAGRAVAPGVTTDEIDALVHSEIVKRKAYPSPLNYHSFPKSCCTSVNEVICHGIPDKRPLEEGDIVNLDITVYYNGYHGDCSEMFVVGDPDKLDENGRKLLQTTYDCWISACQIVEPNRHYKEIGAVIEDYVSPRGFASVRQFCGHGIGSIFHTNPNILHYRNNEPNGQMAAGHTFTIEPMICEGSAKAVTWPDDWTATMADGKRSAQFEHTLLITDDGVEALTGKLETSPLQFWERDSQVHKGIWLGTSANAQKRHTEINRAHGLV